MPSQKGRDLLLKIGDGGAPETFSTIGAARAAEVILNNQPVDATTMDGAGIQSLAPDAGVQTLEITLEGLFKDAAAEETLRVTAFNRTQKNYQMFFPNGDMIAGAFVVRNYQRAGQYDGLETFSVTLARSGSSTYTAG